MNPPQGHRSKRFDSEAGVERAATPPADWYETAETYDEERRSVFRRNWIAVGLAQTLAESGAYLSGNLLGEPYALVRDQHGALRALSNVCRHHAACILEGEGRTDELVCPYHGWTYHLDGKLRSAPRMAGVRDFDREAYGLPEWRAEVWGPLAFLCLGGSPPPLSDTLRPLEARLDATGFGSLRFFARRSYTLDCNWKVFVDNYLDGGYHVGHLHHDLARHLDLDAYRTEVFDGYSIQSCPPAGNAEQRVDGGALYAFVYPNLMINRYGRLMDTNIVLPLGPRRCSVIFDFFFDGDPEEEREFLDGALAGSHQVQVEDMEICASVQAGLGSSAYDRGRYAPTVEAAAFDFHRLLAQDLDSA